MMRKSEFLKRVREAGEEYKRVVIDSGFTADPLPYIRKHGLVTDGQTDVCGIVSLLRTLDGPRSCRKLSLGDLIPPEEAGERFDDQQQAADALMCEGVI